MEVRDDEMRVGGGGSRRRGGRSSRNRRRKGCRQSKSFSPQQPLLSSKSSMVPGTDTSLPSRLGSIHELVLAHSPSLDSVNHLLQLSDVRSLLWVGVEGSLEDLVGFGGDVEDGWEEVWVFEEGGEGRIGGDGFLPGVSAGYEVDEDNSEGPDIVGSGCVLGDSVEDAAVGLWRHIEATTTSKIACHDLISRQPKVRNLHRPSPPNKDVLRLQIPMEHPLRMAQLNTLADLQESSRDESVVVDVLTLLDDASEEVAGLAEFEDDVYQGRGGDDFAEGDDIGVGGGGDVVV